MINLWNFYFLNGVVNTTRTRKSSCVNAKRHTARCKYTLCCSGNPSVLGPELDRGVPPSQVCTHGYPLPARWGYPHPDLGRLIPVQTWEGGTPPSRAGKRVLPVRKDGGTPCQEGWGTPLLGRMEAPPLGRMGYPPLARLGPPAPHPADVNRLKILPFLILRMRAVKKWSTFRKVSSDVPVIMLTV